VTADGLTRLLGDLSDTGRACWWYRRISMTPCCPAVRCSRISCPGIWSPWRPCSRRPRRRRGPCPPDIGLAGEVSARVSQTARPGEAGMILAPLGVGRL